MAFTFSYLITVETPCNPPAMGDPMDDVVLILLSALEEIQSPPHTYVVQIAPHLEIHRCMIRFL
jgi:hypothetical protein